MSACVSVPCPSSFICGSRWSRADEFSQMNILSDTHLSSDNKVVTNTLNTSTEFYHNQEQRNEILKKIFFLFFPSGGGRIQYLMIQLFLWVFQTRLSDWRDMGSYGAVLWFMRKPFILAHVTGIKLLKEFF